MCTIKHIVILSKCYLNVDATAIGSNNNRWSSILPLGLFLWFMWIYSCEEILFIQCFDYRCVTLSDTSLLNLNYKAGDILSNSMSQRVSPRCLKEIYQSLRCQSKMSAPHFSRQTVTIDATYTVYMQKRKAVNSAYINRTTKYYFIQYNVYAPYKFICNKKRKG